MTDGRTQPPEQIIRALLDAASEALIAVDTDGRIILANEQADRLFGWPKQDLIGKPMADIVPEGLRLEDPEVRARYDPACGGVAGWVADPDLSARRWDGSEFPAEVRLSVFATELGSVVAVTIRDSTTGRRSEQRFRAVLASAPDATIGVNAGGRIVLVNSQAERLFGWTAIELTGQQVEVLVPGRIDKRHIRHRANYLADPRSRPMGAGLQLSGQRKDGTTFPAEISLSTLTEDGGELLVLAAVRDISDRLELEAQRQQRALEAQRAQTDRLDSLGQLAGGVAHDFNNLLGVILNYTALIERKVSDEVVVADLVEIRVAAERGAALIRQLLTFARRDVIRRELHDVTALVRNMATMLDRTIGEHITLHLRMAHGPVLARCDQGQCEQILMNLVINARDAMPTGGDLTLSVGHGDAMASSGSRAVRIQVSDTGQGMKHDVAARAFEPFFTTKAAGTGLGLATVYGIVQQHGGQIEIQSQVGIGTTVTIDLPGAHEVDAMQVDPRAIDAARTFPGGREQVLLVEDELPLRTGTARLLEAAGYGVVVAADGLEALEIFHATPDPGFAIVVTDVAMPRMRGDELARQLGERGADVPIVFMTGYDSGHTALSGPVLPKPVEESSLLTAIREALDA